MKSKSKSKTLFETIKRLQPLEMICIVFVLLLCFFVFINRFFLSQLFNIEGFENGENDAEFQAKFRHLQNDNVYDTFYAKIYDQLFFDKAKAHLELDEIIKKTKVDKTSAVLDIGSGTGHHVNVFNKFAGKVEGLDKSKSMVNIARKTYPSLNFKHGDAADTMIFGQEYFSHITMFYFTIYYFKNKKQVLKNCHKWLKPDGYIAIHMVNRDKFDPILNAANPLEFVSPQKYAKERITKSAIKFNNFEYKSNFEHYPEKNKAIFKEYMKHDKTGNKRSQEQVLYMEKQKDIIQMAKECGFKLVDKIDLTPAQHQYQYVYLFQKK